MTNLTDHDHALSPFPIFAQPGVCEACERGTLVADVQTGTDDEDHIMICEPCWKKARDFAKLAPCGKCGQIRVCVATYVGPRCKTCLTADDLDGRIHTILPEKLGRCQRCGHGHILVLHEGRWLCLRCYVVPSTPFTASTASTVEG